MAYNLYGGVSDQIRCNSNPTEANALDFWVVIYDTIVDKYIEVTTWNAFFAVQPQGTEKRRKIFENVYDFYFITIPATELLPALEVIVIGNEDYFSYLSEWKAIGGGDCTGLLYPAW